MGGGLETMISVVLTGPTQWLKVDVVCRLLLALCGGPSQPVRLYQDEGESFTHVRQNTIFRLPANLLNITTLLQGDPDISNNMNSLIFKAVQDFITQSGRFAME